MEEKDISKQIDDILEGKTNLKDDERKKKLKELFKELDAQNNDIMRNVPKGEFIET